jgi:hypothetical protein
MLLLCVLVLSGCAGMGTADCGDAYQTGQNHGMLGVDESDRLAARCGASFDRARYADGYSDGFSRRGKVWSL